MSATARWLIAAVGALCAVSFAAVALIVSPGEMNRFALWCMVAFCTLIVLACFKGRVRMVAIRLLGACVCAVYIGYIVSEVGHPVPTLRNYRRSDTNLINAVVGFVVFGIPGGCIALAGLIPRRHQPAPSELAEVSCDLEMEDLQPFLERITLLIPTGFGEEEVASAVTLVRTLAMDDEGVLNFNIRYNERNTILRLYVFMDDIDSPAVYFSAPLELAESISAEIQDHQEAQEALLDA